jgi:hypothetical protein
VDHPAAQLTTVPAAIRPRVVSTPVALPFERSMPMTSV